MKKQLILPHASNTLKPLFTQPTHPENTTKTVTLTSREMGDLLMLGMGAFTPLNGFMNQADWRSVCEKMTLKNGVFWPIPITLSCQPEHAKHWSSGDKITLLSPQKKYVGTLTLDDAYTPDKHLESHAVFGTTDNQHPGVQQLFKHGATYLGGSVEVYEPGDFKQDFKNIYLTPNEVRTLFVEKQWFNVAAFQTRNPMHRSHEFLTKIALELCDGVLIHSILGQLKAGDIPAKTRIQAISALIENYYPKNSVLQAGYPMDMRYAGPKEALLHAIFRQNFGCSYMIVGRDHAGVGDYYGPFDAQSIFDTIDQNALRIKPLKIDWTFWCHRCDGMASTKTCPHLPKDRLLLSGTKLREHLSKGEKVPEHFTRPEVLTILQNYYQTL